MDRDERDNVRDILKNCLNCRLEDLDRGMESNCGHDTECKYSFHRYAYPEIKKAFWKAKRNRRATDEQS